MSPVIQVSNLSKSYRLGVIGSRTISEDLNRWWAKLRKQPDPYLRIGQEDLSNRIGERIWALKDINFEVQQGEVLGIIGRNGAGKSTLLKILSRVTAPTSGEVRVKGRIASLLEVGTGFHPELTGRENVFLNGAILGMKREEIERKFDEIVDFSGVEKFIDTPVKRYSSGMYVRLAFAVAAHLEPEILIVDEVLAVGDAEFQKKCLGKMGEVAGEGRTVLFVSHNMVAIQTLCKQAILINNGSIQDHGETDNIISKYLSFSINSNLCECDLIDHQGRSFSREKAIISIWVEDGKGLKNNIFQMGDEIRINFKFSSAGKIENPAFGFGIEDSSTRRIFSLNNYMVPTKNNTLKYINKGIATLVIPSIPLLPGKYFVSISIFEKAKGYVDFIGQAMSFEITPSNIYNSGIIPERDHGVIFVPGDILVSI